MCQIGVPISKMGKNCQIQAWNCQIQVWNCQIQAW
jgi:hypothetical protein